MEELEYQEYLRIMSREYQESEYEAFDFRSPDIDDDIYLEELRAYYRF